MFEKQKLEIRKLKAAEKLALTLSILLAILFVGFILSVAVWRSF